MRSQGLTNNPIKMLDTLSNGGRTYEVVELFAMIKDTGTMPNVMAHTTIINAGGHWNEARKMLERMLALGVQPNVYTYSVLIRGW